MAILKHFHALHQDRGTDVTDPLLVARAPDTVPILAATELLGEHQPCMARIQQQVGVPQAHWSALYEVLLHNFALFVQGLPASEAHHHRGRGGLLRHGLDTALRALILRRGVLLPMAASAEHLAEKQDVWTYAVATASLLHDLGKPVVDQTISLFDDAGRELGRWNPLAGRMPATAARYAVQFVHGRRYRLHPRLPPLLVQYIVPAIGLEWLSRDLEVFEPWVATISGGDPEFAGELGDIIRQADRLSVASELSGAPDAGPATSPAPPSLGQRLGVALRQLVDAGSLPLNRPGAAGWVIDQDLWLVSKRVLDALRDQLAQDSGGGTAPRNERLMDELQQHGIAMPNGDRAIWTATVELTGWQQRLTLLRVPLARLWIDPASRPATVAGRVVPDVGPAPPTVASEEPAHPIHAVPLTGTTQTPASQGASDPLADLPLPTGSDSTTTSPSLETTAAIPDDYEERGLPDNDLLRWVCEGASTGRLKVNTVDARLHVTREGVLLVSPGIFRDFAGVEGWAAAQKKFQKLKLHLKTPEGTNIWTYRVSGDRKSSAQLKGLLVPHEASLAGLKLPDPNPHLSLVQPGSNADAPAHEGMATGP